MRSLSRLSLIICLIGFLLPQLATADTIAPEQDSYINNTSGSRDVNYDSPGPNTTGLLVKGQSGAERFSYMQFTLGGSTVTSATLWLYYYRSWTTGNSWTLRVAGRQDSFDETLITWNNTATTLRSTTPPLPSYTTILSALLLPGGVGSQDVGTWQGIDMTTFYNAHLGQTVVIRLTNTDNDGNKGGSFEDREGSRTGDPLKAPYIAVDVANIPPTASLAVCHDTGIAPYSVLLDASGSSDSDGTITSYDWDFDGDGTSDQTTTASTLFHTYLTAGVYNTRVKVTDNRGDSTTSSAVPITVQTGASPYVLVTALDPNGGSPLSGSQVVTSITAGGNTFTSLMGPPDDGLHVETSGPGSFSPIVNLVGLELHDALLGLPTVPGSAIRAFFDRPVSPDGTSKPEIFFLEWSDSTDSFQVQFLTSGPGETPVIAATVPIYACQYNGLTTTRIQTSSNGIQPIGGVGFDLDALSVSGIRGIQIPSDGNSPGIDPAVVAYVIKPCSTPFADADGDHDVDQNDFGFFQRCYTGSGNTPAFNPTDCFCFDRDHDSDVDEFDLTPFTNCHTGTGVLWTPTENCPS